MHSNSNIFRLPLLILSCILLSLAACKKDAESGLSHEDAAAMREWLKGDWVIWAKAEMASTDLTKLPKGCPAKYTFTWQGDERLDLAITNFKVGKMPFAITFRCETTIAPLTSFDEDVYSGEHWVRFEGKDGFVTTSAKEQGTHREASGANCHGFYNTHTHEFYCFIDYNMMSVTTHCPRQVLDPALLAKYEELLQQYLKEFNSWGK